MSKLNKPKNILVLHGLGPKKFRLSTVEQIDLMFMERFYGSEFFEHDLHIPFPSLLKKLKYDLIILSSTFLAKIAHPRFLNKINREYSFLEDKDSLVVAFPQDDYWCQQDRDNWYAKYVDVLVSVFDQSNWSVLYPQFLQTKKKIIRGHTVYLTTELVDKCNTLTSYPKKYDIVYRTRGTPSFPNKLGIIKYELGKNFLNHLNRDINVNFSNKSEDILYGDDWLEFLASSKAVIGSNSGSSILIKNHQEMLSMKKAMISNSTQLAGGTQQFPINEKKDYFLTDISPRNIEAALTETLQILLPGPYGGILKPKHDYLILKEDFSNVNEIADILSDKNEVRRIVNNCKQTILNDKSLKVDDLENQIKNLLRPVSSNTYLTKAQKIYLLLYQRSHQFILYAKYSTFYVIKNRLPKFIFVYIRKKYFKI